MRLALYLSLFLTGAAMSGTRSVQSARAEASFSFADGKRVRVLYGRPAAGGQQIFGGLVPFDKIWAPGAGQATRLTTDVPIQIDEVTVPPGSYSLYILPSQRDWILILSQKTGQAANAYPKGYDFAHLRLRKRNLAESVDPFTIVFDSHGPGAAAMKFRWGNTEVWVNFQETQSPANAEGDAS